MPRLRDWVRQHRRQAPFDPWLFAPSGRDWTFLSWSEADERLQRMSRGLGLAAGRRVAYEWRPEPDCWLFDLALQGAGATAVPVAGRRLPSIAAARRRRAEMLLHVDAPPLRAGQPEPAPGGAGIAVVDGGIEVWDEAVTRAAVTTLEARLPAFDRRDIVLFWGQLERPAARALLSWATWKGAVLLFEGEPARRMMTAFWARPTVLCGNLATLEELRQGLESLVGRRSSLRRRRHLAARLRAFVVEDGRLPSADVQSYWELLAVALVLPPATPERAGLA